MDYIKKAIRSRAASWTDLHDVLNIFKRTIDRDSELVACFLSKNLESRPREPVWDVLYYQGVRQVLSGDCSDAYAHTYRNDIDEEFSRRQRGRYCMCRLEARIQELVVD